MRLLFLCSGLEPGRDGVGDYARLLAQKCAAAGHETRLVSVRDAACGAGSARVGEWRLHDIFRRPGEARALGAWLREFQPDWASVQFTPYGFHPRGLGGRRAAWLRELLPAKTRRHLMLHEIWLQPGRDGPWRHRALGWAQRRSVDAWTGWGWQPAVVHTQARLYQKRLQARGVTAKLLPICTNFPSTEFSHSNARAAVAKILRRKGQSIDAAALWLGHFGSFHTQAWDFTAFAAKVAANPNLAGRRICFLALGRAAAAPAAFVDAARTVPNADFHVLGELAEDEVPVALQSCDVAFTSTPLDIIEKSSAVAAWRALGVPVLVTRAGATDATRLPPWPDPGLLLADADAPLPWPITPDRVPCPSFLDPAVMARTFLSALENAPATR